MFSRTKTAVLLLTAAGVPIAFYGRLEDDPFSVTKLAVLITGTAFAAGLLLIEVARGSAIRGLRSIAVPALALVVPLAISWTFSPYREWASWGQFSRFNGLIPYIAFALLGFLLVDGCWDQPEILVRALSIVGALVGTYAVVQALGLDPLWTPGLDAGSPYPPSTIGHYNFVGGFLGISLPACIYLWLSDKGRAWTGMATTVMTTTGLLLSNSQGGWMAGVAGAAIVIGSFARRRRPGAQLAGRFVAALVAVGVVFAVTISAGSPTPLFGGTAKSRGLLWGTAVEMGADHPAIGRGPAAYAVEGVRYRDLDYILLERNTRADDPHSVPLSFWANAGVLGLAGFLVLTLWIYRCGTKPGPGHLRDAFFASCIAYLVQSLVSIDVPSLRAGLWISIAGLAITSSRERTSTAVNTVRPPALRVGVVLLAVTLAAGAAWYSVGLLRAHRSFVAANGYFREGRLGPAIDRSEQAIGFRFEPWYLAGYGRGLAISALRAGPAGRTLIDRMADVYSYLDHFPDSFGFTDAAQGFHDWAHFQPDATERAVAYLLAAKEVDPSNPDIDLRLAEALMRAGSYEEARASLERVPVEARSAAAYWGVLSIARVLDRDADGAALALAEGERLDPSACRIIGAGEVLQRYAARSADITSQQDFLIRYNCSLGSYLFLTDMARRAAML